MPRSALGLLALVASAALLFRVADVATQRRRLQTPSTSDAEALQAAQALLQAAIGPFDSNHDGRVDSSDGLSPAILAWLLRLDTNHDGVVDINDFLPAVMSLDTDHDGRINIADLPQDAQAAVRRFDFNHDGQIDNRDLPAILAALQRTPDGSVNMDALPASVRAALLQALDANHDGRLDAADLMLSGNATQTLLSRIRQGTINIDDLPPDVQMRLRCAPARSAPRLHGHDPTPPVPFPSTSRPPHATTPRPHPPRASCRACAARRSTAASSSRSRR